MSMKMMNAAYLVDNVALLSLQEKQDGVEFHCFDMDSKVQIAEGHIGWDVLDKQPFSTLEESARMAALQKIPQLAGLAIAPVAPEMLEQVRGGRKILWQMKKADPELENSPISMDLSIPVQMHRLFRKIRLIICFALWKM